MHISHDFFATKTCPSYEFLVFSGRCGFETVNVRGWRGLGWSAGRVRSVRVRGGSGQDFSNSRVRGGFEFCRCGTRGDKKLQVAQDFNA